MEIQRKMRTRRARYRWMAATNGTISTDNVAEEILLRTDTNPGNIDVAF
jgi:hypothetical protein